MHLGISAVPSYTYDPDAAGGEHIKSMTFQGGGITAEQFFRVAASSFLAEVGDNFTIFAKGSNAAGCGQIDLVAAVECFKAHPLVDPAPLGRAVVAGTDRATVELETATVTQGGALKTEGTGPAQGARVTAVLHSDPIAAGEIPAANAEGETAFEITIPAGFETGAQTLLVSTVGHENIAVEVEVAAATAPVESPGLTASKPNRAKARSPSSPRRTTPSRTATWPTPVPPLA